MATREYDKSNGDKVIVETAPLRVATYKENWDVMRPFVHLAFKALVVVGSALISIIKLLPVLFAHHDNEGAKKTTRIIKIN